MKVVVIFILSLLLAYSSYGAISIIPSTKFPAEFKFLYHSTYFDKGDDLNSLKEALAVLDESLKKMSEEDRLFFMKSVIYKSIMSKKPNEYLRPLPNDSHIIQSFLKSPPEYKLPFYRWLASSLHRDLIILSEGKHFESMLSKLYSSSPLNGPESKTKSKLDLILPWLRFLYSSNQKERVSHVNKFIHSVTRRLSLIAYQYVDYSKFESFTPRAKANDMAFFQVKELTPNEKNQNRSQIEKIVEEVIGNPQKLPTPVPGWRPFDDMKNVSPESDKKVDSSSYTQPEELPKPVNDWVEDF